MTDYSNKRKVTCLTEDPTELGGATAFELLSTIVDEHIKHSNERVERLEEAVRALTQKADDRKMNVSDKGLKQDEDEDISDDEESVVDERDQWTNMFRLLREYLITNGHCKVSRNDNPKLSKWIMNQRNYYSNAKTGKAGMQLSNKRMIKLESIGFSWGKKYPSPASWDEMFEQLQKFNHRMGNCNVPINATNPTPLAKWTAYQRKEYKYFKKGRVSLITLDQIGMLNDIGFHWKGPKL